MSEFDKSYWEDHWSPVNMGESQRLPVNPYLRIETDRLTPGTALEAGCGEGAEALWLAEQGWQVSGVDISATALASARERASELGLDDRVDWVEADLMKWDHAQQWDLVVTNYAHADRGQLALYEQLGRWVAPRGTLLIVGHASGDGHGHGEDGGDSHGHANTHDGGHAHGHDHRHPEEAAADLDAIKSLFADPEWRIDAGYENSRTVHPGGRDVQLDDVVVRVYRNHS